MCPISLQNISLGRSIEPPHIFTTPLLLRTWILVFNKATLLSSICYVPSGELKIPFHVQFAGFYGGGGSSFPCPMIMVLILPPHYYINADLWPIYNSIEIREWEYCKSIDLLINWSRSDNGNTDNRYKPRTAQCWLQFIQSIGRVIKDNWVGRKLASIFTMMWNLKNGKLYKIWVQFLWIWNHCRTTFGPEQLTLLFIFWLLFHING